MQDDQEVTMTENGNPVATAEEADSRTAAITPKDTSTSIDIVPTPGDDAEGQSSSKKSLGSNGPSSLPDTRTCDFEQRDLTESGHVAMTRSTDSADEYVPDIRETEGEHTPSEALASDPRSRPQDAFSYTRFPGIDLTAPIADILDQIPSTKEFSTGTATKEQVEGPYRENKVYMKSLTTAIREYRETTNRLQRSREKKPSLSKRKSISRQNARLKETEVRLAWCLYYPLDQPWHNPPPVKPGGNGKPASLAEKHSLQIVRTSLERGTLTELREGKVEGVEVKIAPDVGRVLDVSDSTVDTVRAHDQRDVKEALRKAKKSLKQSQAVKSPSKKCLKNIKLQRKRLGYLDLDLRYCKYFPVQREYEPVRSFKELGGNLKRRAPAIDGSPAQLWVLMSTLKIKDLHPFREGRFQYKPQAAPKESKALGIAPEPEHTSVARHPDNEPDDENTSGATPGPWESVPEQFDESGILIDSAEDSILEADISPSSDRFETNIQFDKGDSKSESGEVSSASNPQSAGFINDDHFSAPNNDQAPTIPQYDGAQEADLSEDEEPRDLRDLHPHDLNEQMRYFHFMRDPDDVPLKARPRCLCCGSQRHFSRPCKHLWCSKCGNFNLHMSIHCDRDPDPKCARCGGRGHLEPDCSSKLKKSQSEKKCGLCGLEAHSDNECELIWRTAGAPWENRSNVDLARLSCYECGASRHLGNDCPQRQPGKPMGTSTWSFDSKPPAMTVSRFTRAAAPRQQVNHQLTILDDEPRSFPKPTLPKPTTKGTIRIDTKISGPTASSLSRPQPRPESPGNSKKRPLSPPRGNDTRSGPLKTTHNPAFRNGVPSNNRPPLPVPQAVQRGPDPFPRGPVFSGQHPLPPVPPPFNPVNRPRDHNSNRYPDYEADMQYQYSRQPPPPARGPPPPNHYSQGYGQHRQAPSPHAAGQAPLGRYQVRTPQEEVRYRPMPSSAQQNLNRFRR